jgi:hypothetical protein
MCREKKGLELYVDVDGTLCIMTYSKESSAMSSVENTVQQCAVACVRCQCVLLVVAP